MRSVPHLTNPLSLMPRTYRHTFLMMVLSLPVALWLYCPQGASAQGFNWQYSSRFPTEYPTLFVGVFGGYSPYALNSAKLQYQEPLASGGTCNCAEFTNAVGREWRVGIMAEKWLETGNIALYGALTVQSQSESFLADGDSTKGVVNPSVNTKGTFTTRYQFSHTLLQAGLEGGVKYKFYPLPLFVALGISGAYTVQTNLGLIEEATDVDYNYRVTLNSNFVRLNPLSVAATARLGADVALAKGLYATPALFTTWQFRGMDSNPWTRLALGVHVALLFGL
ncbi:MAG: hypothetical protein H9535_15120 [Ignavibacteria bacterium]|nr:hypothetical protein [Ignavibacteria bacterium]